jgi:hypothetical protein
MPGRSHHSAPKFDGTPALLNNFFDEVEQLADTCKLDERQKIEWAIRYAPVDDVELWKQVPNAKGDDWIKFKSNIYALYPGSTGDRKYSIANLELLVDKSAAVPMESSKQYGEYYRAFSKIANFLKEKGRLTDREISGRFLQGFNYIFRNKVRVQLRAENPTHHTDDPYLLEQISSAAQFILSCNHDDVISDTVSNQVPASTIKREQFDVSDIGKYFASNNVNLQTVLAQEVAKYMKTLQLTHQSASPSNAPTQEIYNATMQHAYRDRPKSYECIFCSDPNHYLNSCGIAFDFVQRGLCKRNTEGQIVLPNGERINPRTMFGRNLKERIESWHASNNQQGNVLTSNLFSIADNEDSEAALPKANFVWIEVDDEVGEATEREKEEVELMETLIASTQKKVDDARRKIGAKNSGPQTRSASKIEGKNAPDVPITFDTRVHLPTAAPQANIAPVNQQSAGGLSASNAQFKFVTPVESAAVTDKIAKQSMDAVISLSMREVLAIAPDVRKMVKDQITTRKVAQQNISGAPGMVQSFMTELPPTQEGLKVANHSEELRAIDVLIHGVRTVEGILDEGSQIIAIRKDIWESLGLAARSDYQVVMESATNTTAKTIGLLHNLKLTIAGYDFYVQAQVVEHAPYEMLIGLPFKVLTQSTTQHFEDGSSHITLKDPNTQAIITVPTKARKRGEKKQEKITGF